MIGTVGQIFLYTGVSSTSEIIQITHKHYLSIPEEISHRILQIMAKYTFAVKVPTGFSHASYTQRQKSLGMLPRPIISKSRFKFKCLPCANCLCGECMIFLF